MADVIGLVHFFVQKRLLGFVENTSLMLISMHWEARDWVGCVLELHPCFPSCVAYYVAFTAKTFVAKQTQAVTFHYHSALKFVQYVVDSLSIHLPGREKKRTVKKSKSPGKRKCPVLNQKYLNLTSNGPRALVQQVTILHLCLELDRLPSLQASEMPCSFSIPTNVSSEPIRRFECHERG